MEEYLMRKSFKYDLLRDVLFDTSEISSGSGGLRFDDEKISDLLKLIEREGYEDRITDLKREGR